MLALAEAIVEVLAEILNLGALFFRASGAIRIENLVPRRQLARYIGRGIKPRRMDHATRVGLSVFSRLFNWHDAIVIVRPSTVVRWRRLGWRIFWRRKFRAGRPRGDQRWATFLQNHAKAILACDFVVAVTATFRLLFVFVVIEHGSRRLVRVDVTAHPIADWTLQQLREVVGFDDAHRYLIHDRDSIFATHLDESIKALGLNVLKSPPRSPKANAICERVIGTIRRECLDWLIPISEAHLRAILSSWVEHCNRGRPHSSLGPAVSGPPSTTAVIARQSNFRHRLGEGVAVRSKAVPGGLHHEYVLAPAVA